MGNSRPTGVSHSSEVMTLNRTIADWDILKLHASAQSV
jgi:hypothetical protein